MTSPKSGGGDDGDKPLEPVFTNKEGPDDRAYGEWLRHRVKVERPDKVLDHEDGVYTINTPQITIDGELEHYHFETDDSKPQEQPRPTVYDVVSVPPVAPMVATLGSLTFHGSPLAPGIGSVDVLAEGKPVFRMLRDAVACPLATPLPHGGGVVVPMGPPPTIFVNGFAIARAGDAVMELLGGPNPIAIGATTVLAGPPAPPMMSVDPSSGHPGEDDRSAWERGVDWLDRQFEVDVRARADIHVGESTSKVNLAGAVTDDLDVGGDARVRSEGTLARVDGEIAVDVTIFGFTFEAYQTDVEETVGKWEAHGDVIYDPIRRKPEVEGGGDFELFPEDEQ